MEELMQKKANVNLLNTGSEYVVPNEKFVSIQHEFLGVDDHEEYTMRCFGKYIEEKQRINAV